MSGGGGRNMANRRTSQRHKEAIMTSSGSAGVHNPTLISDNNLMMNNQISTPFEQQDNQDLNNIKGKYNGIQTPLVQDGAINLNRPYTQGGMKQMPRRGRPSRID